MNMNIIDGLHRIWEVQRERLLLLIRKEPSAQKGVFNPNRVYKIILTYP